MPKRHSILARCTAAAIATGALIAMGSSTALAQPTAIESIADNSVSLSAQVRGANVDYTVTNVPSRILFPSECVTVLVDVPRAGEALAPHVIDLILSNDIDALGLISDLRSRGAVVGTDLKVTYSGSVSGSFRDVPAGVYGVLTNCAITLSGFDPNRADYEGIVVFGNGSGSSSGTIFGS
ncbi:MAG: hypothetical protein GX542_07675 [Rhodococcus sp.]|nr:hypothetical protein [Rhodococcus sp. (in: high G+C Gram-positive bacteria)]